MDYICTRPRASRVYNPYTPQRCAITYTYTTGKYTPLPRKPCFSGLKILFGQGFHGNRISLLRRHNVIHITLGLCALGGYANKLTANLLLYIAIFFTKSLHLIFTEMMNNNKLHISRPDKVTVSVVYSDADTNK